MDPREAREWLKGNRTCRSEVLQKHPNLDSIEREMCIIEIDNLMMARALIILQAEIALNPDNIQAHPRMGLRSLSSRPRRML